MAEHLKGVVIAAVAIGIGTVCYRTDRREAVATDDAMAKFHYPRKGSKAYEWDVKNDVFRAVTIYSRFPIVRLTLVRCDGAPVEVERALSLCQVQYAQPFFKGYLTPMSWYVNGWQVGEHTMEAIVHDSNDHQYHIETTFTVEAMAIEDCEQSGRWWTFREDKEYEFVTDCVAMLCFEIPGGYDDDAAGRAERVVCVTYRYIEDDRAEEHDITVRNVAGKRHFSVVPTEKRHWSVITTTCASTAGGEDVHEDGTGERVFVCLGRIRVQAVAHIENIQTGEKRTVSTPFAQYVFSP